MYLISEYRKEKEREEIYIQNHFHMELSSKFLGRQNRDDWEYFAYMVTLESTIHPNSASYNTQFHNDIGHIFKDTETPAAPLPFRALTAILLDDAKGAGFEDWCDELGFDTDSRKALSMYLQCQEQTARFKRAFPRVNLEEDEKITGYYHERPSHRPFQRRPAGLGALSRPVRRHAVSS